MNALTLKNGSDPAATMTSKQLADLTEKRHDSVKRTIETLANQGVITLPQIEEVSNDGPGPKTIGVYRVGKRDSYIIVAQLSPEFTARLVDRWQQLEAQAAPAPVDLSNPAALRTLLLGYVDTVIALKAEVAEMTPKAEFADAVADASNCQTVEETGKVFGWGKIKMFRFLRDDGMLMPNNLPYQAHLEAGRFRVIEKTWTGDDGIVRIYPQTLVTGKGLAFLQKRVAIHREVEHAN